MSDKVYPVLSGRYGQPSAPPIGLSDASSTVVIQMPTQKATHREQEKYCQNLGEDDRTFNHGRPSAQSAAAVGGRLAQAGVRRGRGRCCCCLASFVGTLAAILILLGLAALVLYLVLKPKAPKFSVTKATVNEFKLTTGPPPAGSSSSFNLNTDAVFSIEARNPNKKISFYYDDVAVTLLYADQEIGEGSISAFDQPHKNITSLNLPIQGSQTPLTSATGRTLQSSLQHDASIPLQARAVTKARVKVGGWKSRRYKVHVICSFQLSDLNTNATSVLSDSCKLKLKDIAHINFTF